MDLGLALLGAIGVTVASGDWSARLRDFPPAVRAAAALQSQHVAGGQVGAVSAALGDAYRAAAIQSFTHGYQFALAAAAGCVLLAAVVAALGARHSGQYTYWRIDDGTTCEPTNPTTHRTA